VRDVQTVDAGGGAHKVSQCACGRVLECCVRVYVRVCLYVRVCDVQPGDAGGCAHKVSQCACGRVLECCVRVYVRVCLYVECVMFRRVMRVVVRTRSASAPVDVCWSVVCVCMCV